MTTIYQNGQKYEQLGYSSDGLFELFSKNYKAVFSDDAIWFDGEKIEESTGIESMPRAIIFSAISGNMFVFYSIQSNFFEENSPWEIKFYNRITAFKTTWNDLVLRKTLEEYFLKELEKPDYKTLNNSNIDIADIIENEPALAILTNLKSTTLLNAVNFLPYESKHVFALKGFSHGERIYSQNEAEPDIFYFEN